MDLFEIGGAAIAQESPVLITLMIVAALVVYVVNRTAPLAEMLITDVAKPIVPLAAEGVRTLKATSESQEAQARMNERLCDAVDTSTSATRMLYDERWERDKLERVALDEKVERLQAEMKNIIKTSEKLQEQNLQLKEMDAAKAEKIANQAKEIKGQAEKIKGQAEKIKELEDKNKEIQAELDELRRKFEAKKA